MMENYKDLQQFCVRNCILVLKHICLCYLHKILVKAKILGLDKKNNQSVQYQVEVVVFYVNIVTQNKCFENKMQFLKTNCNPLKAVYGISYCCIFNTSLQLSDNNLISQ